MTVKEALKQIEGNRVKIYSVPNEFGGTTIYFQGEKQYIHEKMLNRECKYVKNNHIYIDRIPDKNNLECFVF